jgi:SAM-dependent methyltransferase
LSVESLRAGILRGASEPAAFRAAFLAVPPSARDAWVDGVLGLGPVPADGGDLPRGCVPYLPCPVDAIVQVVDQARVGPADVFVDVGSGLGRATALVHLLTGATAVGIEIQRALVAGARDLAARLHLTAVSTIEGDAADVARLAPHGSVFFLYCPFGGERLAKVMRELEAIARTRAIRVRCVDML